MSRVLLASFLFLSLGACVEPLPEDNSGNSARADELSRDSYSPYFKVQFDYAYVTVKVDSPFSVDVVVQNSDVDSACPLATGSTNQAISFLAWQGSSSLIVKEEVSQVSVTTRPIPGCGKNPGQPSADDLVACETIKKLLASGDDSSSACYSG